MKSKTPGFASVLAALVTIALAGCSGNSSEPEKEPQTIAFSNAGPIAKTFGDAPFANTASGGSGTGEVGYLSRNTAVASVNASGLVTILGAGTVVIDATKQADSRYAAASTSYTINIARAPQTIAFTSAGPLEQRTGDEFENVVTGGSGSGAVTYTTDNPAVALVNATTGLVSAVSTGTAHISATKAESANHLQAQAQYAVNISARRLGKMTAWIGPSDTELHFSAAALGAELIRPTTAGCIQPDIAPCMVLANTELSTTSLIDPAATTGRAAPYWLRRGARTTQPVLADSTRFAGTSWNGAVQVFKGKIWAYMAGRITSSDDGQSWVDRGPTPLSASYDARAAVFQGKMWLVTGGTTPTGSTDIWSSSDGINFTLATRAPFDERFGHALAVFNDRLWMIGGAIFNQTQFRELASSEVWSSGDGVTWRREVASAAFSPRYNFGLNVFIGRLWVIAGEGQRGTGAGDGQQSLGDVWSSADGRTWRAEGVPFDVVPRASFATAVLGNRMFVSGGETGSSSRKDLWHSENGQDWTLVAAEADLGARGSHLFVVFREILWSLGGRDFVKWTDSFVEDQTFGEVWSSTNGLAWTRRDPGAPFNPRFEQEMIEFAGRLWIAGSKSATTPDLQIWSSADGNDWVRSSGASVIPPRLYFTLSVFNNKLWLIGGATPTAPTFYRHQNDVWSSVDGETWVLETAAAAFSARRAHSTFVTGGRLYLVGGRLGDNNLSDVWSSTDGVNWVEDIAIAAFGRRAGHSTVSFNSRIWLLGGDDNGSIWSSPDGLAWTLEKPSETAASSYLIDAQTFNGRLWLMDATSIYSSADALNWRSEASLAGPLAFAAFQSRLWAFGVRQNSGQIWGSQDGVVWRLRNQYEIEIP